MNIYQPVISGSLTVTGSTTFFGNITINSGSLTMTSGSLTGTASFSTSASYAYTASSATSASYVLNAVSSSYAFTASSATNSTSASKAVSSSYSDTASFANNFTVLGNLTVYGTQSVQYITSSQLNVANNIINVNVGTPGVRFGGLSVFDSGSTAGATGSLFWDSQNNNWVYQQVTGSTYTGGMLISGPRNTGGLGNEQGTTSGSLMKGQGGDHVTSSAIFEDGYKATFYGTSLMVSSSGLVGIGETSPASKLSIGGIQGSTIASNVALLVGNNGAAGTVGNLIQIGLHYNPAGATPASIIGANFTSTTGYTKSDIFFATRDVTTDTAPTERLRITSAGNVGIGTTNPIRPLHINAAADTRIVITDSNVSTTAGLYIRQFGSASAIVNNSNGTFQLATNDTYFLTANASGQVGIGTTQPSYTLDVSGTGRFTSTISSTTGTTGATIKLGGFTNYGTIQDVNDVRRIWFENVGSYRTIFDLPTSGTSFAFRTNDGTSILSLTSAGAATFASSVTAVRGFFNSGGNATDPIISVTGDTNTGFFFPSADTIATTVAGTERMRITTGGNVSVKSDVASNTVFEAWNTNTTNGYGGYIRGGQTSGDYALLVAGSSGADYLKVRGDGYLFSSPTYNNQWPGYSANMYIASDGSMGRITASSRRFKENIIDWSGNGLDTILALKPKTFKYKKDYCNSPDNIDFLGLIAEEVAEVSPYLAQYENLDRTGLVENVRYDTIVVPLIKAIQELKAELDTAKAEITELKNK